MLKEENNKIVIGDGFYIEEAMKNLTEEEKERVIKVLKILKSLYFSSSLASIVNCAAEALSKVIGKQAKPLALELLLADISAGVFVKNNEDTISSGQIQTSMYALQQRWNKMLEEITVPFYGKGKELLQMGWKESIER